MSHGANVPFSLDRSSSLDRPGLRRSSVTHEQFDRLVRDAHRVPPARGRQVAPHSTDPKTQEFLPGFVNGSHTGYGGSTSRSPQRWRSRFA